VVNVNFRTSTSSSPSFGDKSLHSRLSTQLKCSSTEEKKQRHRKLARAAGVEKRGAAALWCGASDGRAANGRELVFTAVAKQEK
jgi:hypothetical protein